MVLHIKSDQGHETGFAEMEFSRDMCRACIIINTYSSKI